MDPKDLVLLLKNHTVKGNGQKTNSSLMNKTGVRKIPLKRKRTYRGQSISIEERKDGRFNAYVDSKLIGNYFSASEAEAYAEGHIDKVRSVSGILTKDNRVARQADASKFPDPYYIVRRWDDEGKKQYAHFYPPKDGKPPRGFKTKTEAEKFMKEWGIDGKVVNATQAKNYEVPKRWGYVDKPKVDSRASGVVLHKQKLKQPRSATQAIKMIAKREIPVTGSLELQNEFDDVNNQHFKGKLKDATIMKAYLPKVKHRAFIEPNTRIIIINTAKTPTLEEQKLALRHEIVHLAGFHGHGFLFELTAERIGAPVAEYKGKFITRKERDEIKIARAVERERLKREAREKKMGMKKGEGTLMREGKPVARVIFYEGKQGIKTAKRVSDISDLPKSASTVAITTFDGIGYPKGKMQVIPKTSLVDYTLTR